MSFKIEMPWGLFMNATPDSRFIGTQAHRVAEVGTDEGEFAALFSTLWRGKLWLVLSLLLGASVGLYQALALSDPRYRATAVVVLDGGTDPVVQFTDFLPTMSGDQTIINTELEVLRSTSLIQEVAVSENLSSDPEFNPALRPPSLVYRALEKARQILSRPVSTAVETGPNAVIEALRRNLTVRNVPDSMVFEITIETGDPGKAAHLANVFADRYLERQLEAKFDATQRATEWLAEKVAELEVDLQASEATMNAFAAEMELISAETLEILSAQLKDVRDRIAAWESAIERGEGTSRTATRLEQLRFLEAELADKIARQSHDLVTLEQLQREAAADRQIYEYFLGRLKETSVQEGIQQADARLLSPALVPDAPSTPRPALNAGLAAALALLVAAISLIARETRSATFRTADDLEEVTGLPVLGQIPRIPARGRRGLLHYTRSKPNSAAVEAIRNLRTTLMMTGGARGPKVVLSTSSLPGEGKTTQTLTLAQNLTGVRKRVLVIEGDVRKRVFREYFNAPDGPGWVEVMNDKCSTDDAAWHCEDLGVDILFGSETKANPADIFSSARFRRLLRQLRKSYDVILIDTPPVLLVPDARVIAQQSDAVIYTVRWDKTREKQVLQGLKAFRSVGVEVTGTVLGQVNPRGMKRYGYGKDYGTYGTSGYYQS